MTVDREQRLLAASRGLVREPIRRAADFKSYPGLAAGRGLMRDLIIAALETGCRSGEPLSLQWREVPRGADGAPVRIELSADKTTTRADPVGDRTAPRGPERRQCGPDGEPLPPTA